MLLWIHEMKKYINYRTSSQDGGIGKQASPPSTTTEKKFYLDYETNNTQNHQKVEPYASPTTKDGKKPYLDG